MRIIWMVAIVLLLVFVVPVYADGAEPGGLTITFTTNVEWLVADGTDSCLATVQVNNGLEPLQNLEVVFSVVDTEYGTFDQTTRTTNDLGMAVSNFTVKHRSGTDD